MDLVLENPGNFSERSREVLEFSKLRCGRRTLWCRCRCQNLRKLAHYLYIQKVAGGRGSVPGPIVTAACLYI